MSLTSYRAAPPRVNLVAPVAIATIAASAAARNADTIEKENPEKPGRALVWKVIGNPLGGPSERRRLVAQSSAVGNASMVARNGKVVIAMRRNIGGRRKNTAN